MYLNLTIKRNRSSLTVTSVIEKHLIANANVTADAIANRQAGSTMRGGSR